MKGKFVLVLFLLLAVAVFAQKNLVPASTSAFTGIDLPAGSRQDKRLFSIAVVRTFLEGETKKFGVTVSDAELFRLPPGVDHTNSIRTALRDKGWEEKRLDTRPEYMWLTKQGQYFFMYWSANPKNPELYFGKPEGIPVFESSTPLFDNQSVVQQQQPATQNSLPPVQQEQTQQTQPPSQQPEIQSLQSVRIDGYTYSVTNFDDGWVAKPFADYVQVTKGAITVLLHYAIEIDDNLRNTGNVEGTLFDRLMQPRYIVSNLRKYDNNGPCYFCIYFYEADVVEKSTGRKYYTGFRVLIESGIARCIEIIAPSVHEFQKEFPNQEKIAGMLGYNRFAVALADLVGTWEESSGAAANMYNVVTGAYAGMATASSAHSFTFNADGTYNSKHSGAHGMVGSMTFFDQKYEGKLTVTQWDITMTNRWEGKTEYWWAHFEAVRGGRVLHITDKAASAMHYALVKTK